MLFRFNSVHLAAGWLFTLLGLVALVVGARGYFTNGVIRPGWLFAGLVAVVAGSAVVRWARRARSE